MEIFVRPPGKRLQNLTLLSGGEKAMTAIALVFSIFQLNPAPFCMLDEVDAPLDDANVGRFSAVVQEMSSADHGDINEKRIAALTRLATLISSAVFSMECQSSLPSCWNRRP